MPNKSHKEIAVDWSSSHKTFTSPKTTILLSPCNEKLGFIHPCNILFSNHYWLFHLCHHPITNFFLACVSAGNNWLNAWILYLYRLKTLCRKHQSDGFVSVIFPASQALFLPHVLAIKFSMTICKLWARSMLKNGLLLCD